MMVWVERNGLGRVKGIYANRQPGYAEELLDNDHPDVVAFNAPPPPLTVDQIYDQTVQNERLLKAVILAINDGSLTVGSNRTNAQLKSILKAKM